MAKYKIEYTFSGFGFATVEAKDEQEATDKFNDGDVEDEKQGGKDYEIYEVNEIKEGEK